MRKGSGLLIKHYSAVINMLPSQLGATGLNRTNATDSSSTLDLLPLHPVALTEIIVPSISDPTRPTTTQKKRETEIQQNRTKSGQSATCKQHRMKIESKAASKMVVPPSAYAQKVFELCRVTSHHASVNHMTFVAFKLHSEQQHVRCCDVKLVISSSGYFLVVND